MKTFLVILITCAAMLAQTPTPKLDYLDDRVDVNEDGEQLSVGIEGFYDPDGTARYQRAYVYDYVASETCLTIDQDGKLDTAGNTDRAALECTVKLLLQLQRQMRRDSAAKAREAEELYRRAYPQFYFKAPTEVL